MFHVNSAFVSGVIKSFLYNGLNMKSENSNQNKKRLDSGTHLRDT